MGFLVSWRHAGQRADTSTLVLALPGETPYPLGASGPYLQIKEIQTMVLTFYSCFFGQMQGGELSVSELGLGQWLLAQVSECRGERRGLVP